MSKQPEPAEGADAPQAYDAVKGYWRNGAGALIPVSKIKPIDKARNELVLDLVAKADAMNKQLAGFKADVMAQVEAFVASSAAEFGVTMRGAAGKGNVTLTSFDGRYRIVRQVSDRIAFDERLQVAKALIDGCVHRWAKGANHNIQALVNHAFRVDKAGEVSVGGVLSLRTLEIDDPEWKRAMEAIAASMQAVSSVQYVRFYERDRDGKYQPISLNTAVL